MKKIFLILAVLVLAAPAMAVVDIDANQVGDTNEVYIQATWSGESGKIPRAFALNITVTAGTITDVTNYHTGESQGPGNRGFGIFPASFAREIDADDPCWADVNYTPVADVNDLVGGTLGLDPNGITIEMGSLYTGPNAPNDPPYTLCSVWVSGDTNMCLALNVGRAGIVLEDGNAPSSVTGMSCTPVVLAAVCTVPDVLGDANAVAQAAIIAANFTVGTISNECSPTVPLGDVISTTPAAGATPGCATAVDIKLAKCCDTDADTFVAFADVTHLVNDLIICGWFCMPGMGCWDPVNDIDDDGFLAFADVTALVNYLIANSWFVMCP